MSESGTFDLIAVGGGAAGCAAALAAAGAGLSVALVEAGRIGGNHLHFADVPAAELLGTASVLRTVASAGEFGIGAGAVSLDLATSQRRRRETVDSLACALDARLASAGVEVVPGRATLRGPGEVRVEGAGSPVELRARSVVLATGSAPASLEAVSFDERVLSPESAFALERVPSSVVVVGAGIVGCELASMLRDFGAEVTLVESAPRLLPEADRDVAGAFAAALARRGVKVLAGTRAVGVSGSPGSVRVELAAGSAELEAEVAVLAVGRRPASGGVLGEGCGVYLGPGGAVRVDERMRTSAAGVFAIGDLTGSPHLTHVGVAEAAVAVREVLGETTIPIESSTVPWCSYGHPELAWAGMSEEAARAAGIDVVVATDHYAGNGRARIVGETDGFVKLVAERLPDGGAGPLLGVHLVGPWVSEQLAQAHLALAWSASPAELADLVQPHPTLSEAFGEATLLLAGRGLHLS